jgi:Flp pilus assembly protein TadD
MMGRTRVSGGRVTGKTSWWRLVIGAALVCALLEWPCGANGGISFCETAEFPEQVLHEAEDLERKGQLQDAMACLSHAANHGFGEEPDIHAALGSLFESMGKHGEAVEALTLASSLQPDDALFALRLGNLNSAIGRDADAVEHLRAAATLRPDSPVPLNNIGLALHRMGDDAGAEAAYLEALGRVDGQVRGQEGAVDQGGKCMVQNNMGNLYRAQGGRESEALALFKDAIDDACPGVDAHINMASMLLDMGMPGEAQRVASAAARDNQVALRLLVIAMVVQDRMGEAVEELRRRDATWGDAEWGSSDGGSHVDVDVNVDVDVDVNVDVDGNQHHGDGGGRGGGGGAGGGGGGGGIGDIISQVVTSLSSMGHGESALELWSRLGLSSADDFYHAAYIALDLHNLRDVARSQPRLPTQDYHVQCVKPSSILMMMI